MANKTKLGITGRINAYFFYQMYVESLKESVSNRNVIDWCMKAGLLTNSYECPACKASMYLKQRKESTDKWEWACRKDGQTRKRTIRKGSCFDKSNLCISEILFLIWYWMNKCSQESVINEIGCAPLTVSEWYGFCREICIKVCIKTSEKIGGEGRVVEFEESKIGKRKNKKNFIQQEEEYRCVYVGVEKETDKYFYIVKPLQSKECMYQTLRDWILPGTTIISDCWSTYGCLDDEDFQLLRDLNGLTFQGHEIGVPDNAGRGGFRYVKRSMKGLSKNQYDSHLAEYMWRRRNKTEIQQEFVSFIEAIKSVYPPQTADNL